MLRSDRTLVLPRDGYSDFDGLVGSDLGFHAGTEESLRQRQTFGFHDDGTFAHRVVVPPPDRFDNNWIYFQSFSWTGGESVMS